MPSSNKFSPSDLRTAITTFATLLRSHKEVINRLNVYPVPDGDTGTNMTLTVESVVAAFDSLEADPSMEDVCQAMARGSLMGARGNSGVILSQLLRGLAEKLRAAAAVTPQLLAESLSHADALARQAVVRPIEGTILSVARAAAQGANSATSSLTHLVHAARDRAREALALTPEQLPVLKQAGVVDSGGAGLLLLFDALCNVIAHDPLPQAPPVSSVVLTSSSSSEDVSSDSENRQRFEVMHFLDADESKLGALRDAWSALGDSIVIIGGEGLYNCHIHTNDIGATLEAAIDAGRPRDIRVTDLREQVTEESWVSEVATVSDPPAAPPMTSIVAVAAGEGNARIFRSLGVRELVRGGQSMNPSTADLVAAVRATGSRQVVILPNNKNITPVAEQVAALVEQVVTVVPTNSVVEGFAALLGYDPELPARENATAMASAAHDVVAGEVTRAVRDTNTDVGAVHVGDWIGLGDAGVRSIGDSILSASTRLLADLLGANHELVTLIEGEGSSPALSRDIGAFLSAEYPGVRVEVHPGGQSLYPYFFGIE